MRTRRLLALAALLPGTVLAGCTASSLAHGPHSTPSSRPTTGITGLFLAVGGPGGAPNVKQRGRVIVTGDTGTTTLAVGPNGRFSTTLAPGRYRLVGYSPQYNDGHVPCQALASVVVRAGRVTHASVYCQRR